MRLGGLYRFTDGVNSLMVQDAYIQNSEGLWTLFLRVLLQDTMSYETDSHAALFSIAFLTPSLQPTWHPGSTIQPNDGPIKHHVLYTCPNNARKFLSGPAPFWKLHTLLQTRSDLVAHHGRHGGLKGPRSNSDYADSETRQIARQRKSHACNGALGGCIGRLSHLPVKGGGRGNHDDHTVLGVIRWRDKGCRF